MITMELLGKIKRLYFRDKKSQHEIAKYTGVQADRILTHPADSILTQDG